MLERAGPHPRWRASLNPNARYPDWLARRLLAAHIPLSVANAGISGNRILQNGQIPMFGPPAARAASPRTRSTGQASARSSSSKAPTTSAKATPLPAKSSPGSPQRDAGRRSGRRPDTAAVPRHRPRTPGSGRLCMDRGTPPAHQPKRGSRTQAALHPPGSCSRQRNTRGRSARSRHPQDRQPETAPPAEPHLQGFFRALSRTRTGDPFLTIATWEVR